MKEGAWINAKTGKYVWITEHASWVQDPENAQRLGLPEEAIVRLSKMPWDFNGEGRRAILLEVMSHGFIRVRGHGSLCTFEFTLPTMEAIHVAAGFMEEHFGPMMLCRFNDIAKTESFESTYGKLRSALESGQLRERMGKVVFWEPRRPYFMVSRRNALLLPSGRTAQELVELIRPHLGRTFGWLALEDGRAWRVAPQTGHLLLSPHRVFQGLDTCQDCGSPTGKDIPCQCQNKDLCPDCGLPVLWPIVGTNCVDPEECDQISIVPEVARLLHLCLEWDRVNTYAFETEHAAFAKRIYA